MTYIPSEYKLIKNLMNLDSVNSINDLIGDRNLEDFTGANWTFADKIPRYIKEINEMKKKIKSLQEQGYTITPEYKTTKEYEKLESDLMDKKRHYDQLKSSNNINEVFLALNSTVHETKRQVMLMNDQHEDYKRMMENTHKKSSDWKPGDFDFLYSYQKNLDYKGLYENIITNGAQQKWKTAYTLLSKLKPEESKKVMSNLSYIGLVSKLENISHEKAWNTLKIENKEWQAFMNIINQYLLANEDKTPEDVKKIFDFSSEYKRLGNVTHELVWDMLEIHVKGWEAFVDKILNSQKHYISVTQNDGISIPSCFNNKRIGGARL